MNHPLIGDSAPEIGYMNHPLIHGWEHGMQCIDTPSNTKSKPQRGTAHQAPDPYARAYARATARAHALVPTSLVPEIAFRASPAAFDVALGTALGTALG